jgi:hypothetical protein
MPVVVLLLMACGGSVGADIAPLIQHRNKEIKMPKSIINIVRKIDGSAEVIINIFGDLPAGATINLPAGIFAILVREISDPAFADFKWSSE